MRRAVITVSVAVAVALVAGFVVWRLRVTTRWLFARPFTIESTAGDSDRIHYFQVKGDRKAIDGFRLGRPDATIQATEEALRRCMEAVGQTVDDHQVANDEWQITRGADGAIEWFGFLPKPGMHWSVGGMQFSADDSFEAVLARIPHEAKDVQTSSRWCWQ